MDAFADAAEAYEFRQEVLPLQSPDDCRWFWQQVMTPDQLESTLNAVRDVCLRIARDMELDPSIHYRGGYQDGLPVLVCSSEVAEVFYAQIPSERHSFLKFYLEVV